MTAPLRRGACPGLADPMPTGDGLLARLVLDGSTVGLDGFAGLCAAARAHGNGVIEITARGNLQVRGLTAATTPGFAADVARLGLRVSDGVPVLADPLGGLGLGTRDSERLAGALRRVLALASWRRRLSPKVSVAIDGGAALHLDAVAADLRFRLPDDAAAPVHVGVAGAAVDATWIGGIAAERVVEAAVQLLAVIAAQGEEARARDVARNDSAAFRAAIADFLKDVPPPPARPAAQPIATHGLRDGRVALGIGLAFGHADARALENLTEAARRSGADGLRLAPGRALLVVGLALSAVPSLVATAAALGCVVDARDPRRHVVACAGAPICAAAEMPSRALAPALAAAAQPLLDGSLVLHVSGCRKGCAHHAAAALTLVGDAGGCAVVLGGSPGDAARVRLAPEDLPVRLARLSAEVERLRRPGDSAADAVSRLGADRAAAVLAEARHG